MKKILSIFALFAMCGMAQAEPGYELPLPTVPDIKVCGKSNTCKKYFKADRINMLEAFNELKNSYLDGCIKLIVVSNDLVPEVKGAVINTVANYCSGDSAFSPYTKGSLQSLNEKITHVEGGLQLVYVSEEIKTKSDNPTTTTVLIDHALEQIEGNLMGYREAYDVIYQNSLSK